MANEYEDRTQGLNENGLVDGNGHANGNGYTNGNASGNGHANGNGPEKHHNHESQPLMSRPLPGFLSPHMATERKTWTKMAVTFCVLLVTIVLGILSIYWGADHSLQYNLPVFTVSIIDFDQGEVGPYIQQMGQEARAANPGKTVGFISVPGERYDFSNEETLKALKDEQFWFGIVIQANATTAMNYAYEQGNTSYDPLGSVHMIFEEGRNALAIDEFGLPMVQTFLNDFVFKFAKMKQAQMATANAGNAAALQRQVQNPIPIGYSTYNTAPYVPSTAEAATEIGTIYLIIISFLSVLMFGALNEAMMGKISTGRYYAYRMLLFPTIYLPLSALYLALSCMWHIKFGLFFGTAGYVIYWMLTWIGMMAFGLAVENVNNVLGPPFTPVFFVFWVISNVATGFFPIELESNFYLWGLAWPLRHVLIGAKALVFGTKNLLGLNFGVLIAWVAVSVALQPLTIWLQLRRQKAHVEKQRRQVLERVYGAGEDDSVTEKEE